MNATTRTTTHLSARFVLRTSGIRETSPPTMLRRRCGTFRCVNCVTYGDIMRFAGIGTAEDARGCAARRRATRARNFMVVEERMGDKLYAGARRRKKRLE